MKNLISKVFVVVALISGAQAFAMQGEDGQPQVNPTLISKIGGAVSSAAVFVKGYTWDPVYGYVIKPVADYTVIPVYNAVLNNPKTSAAAVVALFASIYAYKKYVANKAKNADEESEEDVVAQKTVATVTK